MSSNPDSDSGKHAPQDQAWVRLSLRHTGAMPESPYEGIPAHLAPALSRWLEQSFEDMEDGDHRGLYLPAVVALQEGAWPSSELITAYGLRIRQPLEHIGDVGDLLHDDEEAALDLIDAVVADLGRTEYLAGCVERLDAILDVGASVWAVHRGPPHWQLVRRIDPIVTDRAAQLMSAGGSVGTHLAAAWTAMYGRNSSPATVVLEAVKALEAAGQPVIVPDDAKATLGKMIPALRAKPAKWTSAAGTVGQVADALQSVWDLRVAHGEPHRVNTVDPQAAEAALHLAFTYCHWFTSGLVHRVQ